MQLQKEREKILEYKRQVQNLVNKSKKIVQLKPRNPDYRSNKPIILRALCDYKQDQVCAVTQNAAKVFPFSLDGCLSIERAELKLGFGEHPCKCLSLYTKGKLLKQWSHFVLNHVIIINK